MSDIWTEDGSPPGTVFTESTVPGTSFVKPMRFEQTQLGSLIPLDGDGETWTERTTGSLIFDGSTTGPRPVRRNTPDERESVMVEPE